MGSARLATDDDIDALTRLVEVAVDSTRYRRGGELLAHTDRSRDPRARVVEAIDADDRVAFAGIFQNAVLGICLVHLEPTFKGLIGVVTELFVDMDAREVGIGEALVDSALTWCRQRGANGVDIDVLPGDRQMKNLCERSGLVARKLTMHADLGDEGTRRINLD